MTNGVKSQNVAGTRFGIGTFKVGGDRAGQRDGNAAGRIDVSCAAAASHLIGCGVSSERADDSSGCAAGQPRSHGSHRPRARLDG